MLIIADSLPKLRFSELMDVYSEGNAAYGAEHFPNETPYQQLFGAERDFFQYLNDVFFQQSDAIYAIWEVGKHYIAALRLEPYSDGYLLSALETRPHARNRGYASQLLCAVIDHLSIYGFGTLYSHVSKSNKASLIVHEKCGFSISKDNAVFLDGSVSNRFYTLEYHY